MSCQQFHRSVETAEDQHLEPDIREFDSHLLECGSCRTFWEGRQKLYAAIDDARASRPTIDFADAVLQQLALDAEISQPVKPATYEKPSESRSLIAVSVVASAVLAFVFIVTLQDESPEHAVSETDHAEANPQAAQVQDAIPQIVEGAQTAYRSVTEDAMASLTDVVPVPSIPNFGLLETSAGDATVNPPGQQPAEESTPFPSPATPRPLNDAFQFLRQLVPEGQPATL